MLSLLLESTLSFSNALETAFNTFSGVVDLSLDFCRLNIGDKMGHCTNKFTDLFTQHNEFL